MKASPNKYRVEHPYIPESALTGNNGMFIIPHYKVTDYELRCMVSNGEFWAPVSMAGYDNLYEVSTYGRVKALKKAVNMPNGAIRHHEEAFLSHDIIDCWYPRVKLCNNGVNKNVLVHVLVAQAFIANPNNYSVVNHIDGDKTNCAVNNLEWCTVEYNMFHAIESGLKSGFKKDEILLIKEMLDNGIHILDIASQFEKSRQTISDIKHGRHRNLNPEPPSRYTGVPLWEHVSVTVSHKKKEASRCPTWEEMCFVKNMFWNEDEVVVQYHPAKSDYVSMHPFCLHLWKPIGVTLPTPDPLMVGVNLGNNNSNL